MKKNVKKICVIAGLLIAFKAQAVGVFTKPTGFDLEVKRGETAEVELLVGNVFDKPASYRIYADNYSEEIKFSPSEFRLYPGENQIVKIALAGQKFGQKNTNISIIASPLGGSGLIASSGVKIPLDFRVTGFWPLVVLWIAVSTACFAVIFVVKLIMLRQNKLKIL